MRVYVALDVELDTESSATGAGTEAVHQALDVLLDDYLLEAQSDRMPFLHYYYLRLAGIGNTQRELAESVKRRNETRRAIAAGS